MRKRDLTKAAFDKLLAQLDADPELAALKYREIHRKIAGFFYGKGCADPFELTDFTFDRVAQIIDAGTQIEADAPFVFFRGVAKKIFLEYLRKIKPVDIKSVSESRMPVDDPDENIVEVEDYENRELRAQCMDQCLSNLNNEKRDLILQYMRGQKRERIDSRRKMAERLGINSNALSLRVFKIKTELKGCRDKCLKAIADGKET